MFVQFAKKLRQFSCHLSDTEAKGLDSEQTARVHQHVTSDQRQVGRLCIWIIHQHRAAESGPGRRPGRRAVVCFSTFGPVIRAHNAIRKRLRHTRREHEMILTETSQRTKGACIVSSSFIPEPGRPFLERSSDFASCCEHNPRPSCPWYNPTFSAGLH